MMNQQNQDEKLLTGIEELAKLRANTSIEKTIISKTLPSAKEVKQVLTIIRRDDEKKMTKESKKVKKL